MIEWVRYHACHGASKFYVYEHNSNSTFAGRYGDLEHLIETKPVEMPKSAGPQMMIYSQCFVYHAPKHRWLAFIDADEFVVLPGGGGKLVDFLPQFSGHPALAVNWKIFGSSGHDRRPPGGVLAHYTACIDDDTYAGSQHVKLILNTQQSFGLRSPHTQQSRDGRPTISSNKVPVHAHRSLPTAVWTDIELYHYYTKSREEWETRMVRGRGVLDEPNVTPPNWGTFDSTNEQARGTCLLAQQFWDSHKC